MRIQILKIDNAAVKNTEKKGNMQSPKSNSTKSKIRASF